MSWKDQFSITGMTSINPLYWWCQTETKMLVNLEQGTQSEKGNSSSHCQISDNGGHRIHLKSHATYKHYSWENALVVYEKSYQSWANHHCECNFLHSNKSTEYFFPGNTVALKHMHGVALPVDIWHKNNSVCVFSGKLFNISKQWCGHIRTAFHTAFVSSN